MKIVAHPALNIFIYSSPFASTVCILSSLGAVHQIQRRTGSAVCLRCLCSSFNLVDNYISTFLGFERYEYQTIC